MYIIISFYRVCQYFTKPKECSTVIYSICHHNGRKHLQLCLTPDNPEIRLIFCTSIQAQAEMNKLHSKEV